MTSEFVPSSKLVRSASVVCAILTTVLMIILINGLATRYSGQIHAASDRQAVSAGR